MNRDEAQEEINQQYRDYHHVFGDQAGIRVLADISSYTALFDNEMAAWSEDPAYAQGKQDVVRFIFERLGYSDDPMAIIQGILSKRPGVPALPEVEPEN
jgi:hypothetical protein